MQGSFVLVGIVWVGMCMHVAAIEDGNLEYLGIVGLVDHSHVVSPTIPTFAGPTGGDEVQFTTLFDFPDDPFSARRLDNFFEHYGTHIDAPYHFGGTGTQRLDDIPVGNLVANLCVVDVRDQVALNADYQVTIDDLLKWESMFGRIPTGALVAMYSGWDSRWGSEVQYRNADESGALHFPGWGTEAVSFLLDNRDIVGLGVDTLSIDRGVSSDFSSHTLLMEANKYGIENMANLGDAPTKGGVIVVGAPKLEDGTGSTVRVITLVMNSCPTMVVSKTVILLALALFSVMFF